MFKKNTYTGFDINWDKIPDDNTTKRNLKFLYDNITPMSKNMTYVINGVPIVFDKKDSDIAVTLSGGADSSMLLYLLCTIIRTQALKTRIHCITLLRFTEDRIYLEDVVTGVIKYIRDKFPDIEIIDVYQEVTWYCPKLRNGQMLAIPLSDDPEPDCIYFAKDISRNCEIVDYNQAW
jgi:3'-phosphoadenosine 5'-phosphosulfate sulfotransferase (PAPS reductase)/FAD synthetase